MELNDHVTEITHKASKRLYLLGILKRASVDVNSLVGNSTVRAPDQL
jgi:hypothetical protein